MVLVTVGLAVVLEALGADSRSAGGVVIRGLGAAIIVFFGDTLRMQVKTRKKLQTNGRLLYDYLQDGQWRKRDEIERVIGESNLDWLLTETEKQRWIEFSGQAMYRLRGSMKQVFRDAVYGDATPQ